MPSTSVDLPPLPDDVRACLSALRRAGGRVFVVGGAVRDMLLGGRPTDFDIATDLHPDAVAETLAGSDTREAALGTCRVATDHRQLTITTMRAEADYGDHRHPDRVQFLDDPVREAPRRDFTVNAIYYDDEARELLDPVGGLADLRDRRLRVIGEPAVRLREDPLRLLRLVRFAASLGFAIDPATAAAARAEAGRVDTLSAERCFEELTRMFTAAGRGEALGLLVELGIAARLLPEVAAMDGVEQPPEYHPEGDVLTHVRLVLENCPAGDAVLAWSAVLHDVGKPPTFRVAADRIRFDGHDTLSARMAEAVLRRLMAPRALRERVVDVCLHHIRFAALPQMRPVRAERWMREPGFADHLAFHRADCLGSHGKLEIYEFARQRHAALPPLREPLLQGRDVIELGVAPGRAVGEVLREVEAQLDELPTTPTREQALVYLRDAVDRRLQGPSS